MIVKLQKSSIKYSNNQTTADKHVINIQLRTVNLILFIQSLYGLTIP